MKDVNLSPPVLHFIFAVTTLPLIASLPKRNPFPLRSGRIPVIGLILVIALGTLTASAQSPDPELLTIEQGAGEPRSVYSIDKLRNEFELHERVTATPWSGEKAISFRGPLLKDILEKNNIAGTREFEVQAYNDFMARITGAEINAYSPILAIEQQCANEDRISGLCAANQTYRPLSVDDGGPFYLIWPLRDLPQAYVLGRKSIWVWFVVAVRPVP